MPRVVVILSLLLGVSVLPACGVADPDGPYLATPKVGECHRLSVEAIRRASDTRQPVPCSAKHTSRTVAVVPQPSKKGASAQGEPGDAEAVAVGKACADGFVRLVGGSSRERAESLYNLAWFTPTKAQRAKGATWLRCDVTLTNDRRAYPIIGKRPLLKDGLQDRERLCGHLIPGEDAKWEFVPCSAEHVFVPAKFIKAGSDVTVANARAAAKKACHDGLYTWSPPTQWGVGDRWLVCWGPVKDAELDGDAILARS